MDYKVYYEFVDLKGTINFSGIFNMLKMLFTLLKFTLNYKNNGVLIYADIDFYDILRC